MKPMFLALATAVALAVATPAHADVLPNEPPNFTLAVAIDSAMRHNPDIQAAEAKLEQAKIEKQEADLWWARAINANANYVAGGNPYLGSVTATGTVLPTAAVGVGMNLGDLLTGPKKSAKADQAIIIAQAELRRTTLAVASNVTAAYQEYQASKQTASLSGELVQAAETDVRVAERGFERGTQAANSLVDARLAVARSRIDGIQAGGAIAKTWSNLLNLMGDDQWIAPNTAPNAANAGRR